MTHQLSPFRRWFELGLALDPQVIHPLPSTHGLRLRRRLRHLPALRLLAALFGGRGGVGIRIGAGSSLRRRCKHTSAKLLLDESLLDNAGVGRRNSFGGCVDKWMGKGRGGVGIFTLVMLVFDAGRRAISISMRGFLARAGEGAGEGAEEVEV